ncbi:MAG: hypothetical protein IJT20_08025 [Synergistaceae bacterium]|nr:hypothetical protein [Synergistaceae bacterium]
MGVGPSAKETSLHHFRDPLLDLFSSDEDIDLLGIILFGSSDKYSEKILTSTRAAIWAQGMRADGAVIFCEGSGNNHVDFANACEQLGRRGIAVAGLTVIGKNGQFVVTNDYMNDNIIDVCKSKGSVEPCIIGENNLSNDDCKKALAILKIKMNKAKEARNLS